MSDNLEDKVRLLEKALARSRKSQELAEQYLENKTRELYAINQELKENQGMLVHHEKMASLGHMAGGIAHEINNPIGYIRSNLSTLKEYGAIIESYVLKAMELASHEGDGGRGERLALLDMQKREDMAYICQDILALTEESMQGIQKVCRIVDGLKVFIHMDDEMEFFEANIHEGIDATLLLLDRDIPENVTVNRVYGDLPKVFCLAAQLNQVFLYVLKNAMEAMPNGGMLTIETRQEGEKVAIQVSDTGKGISQANMKKLFTPFYSTKEIGSGPGLGLSISHGVVKKHKGDIRVDSEEGKGTRVTITIPIRQAAGKADIEDKHA